MQRRLLPALLLSVALAATETAVAARSPKEPTLRPVGADVRLAHRLSIGKADLPGGFKDAGPDTSSNDTFDCAAAPQPDLHRLVMHADVTSHDFRRTDATHGFDLVTSEVALFRNQADATASLAWIRRLPQSVLDKCFTAAVRSGLPKTAKPLDVHVTTRHRLVRDIRIDVWEVQAFATSQTTTAHFDIVVASYQRGRALMMLLLTNVGPGLDPTLVRSLSATVSSRLERATL